MPPRTLNIILFAVLLAGMCHFAHRRTRTAMLVADGLELIDRYYVEPVDRDKLLVAAMKGMTSELDQHSEFIPGEKYVNFQDMINQEFAGIGILVDQIEEDQPVRVITPLVGSPALAAGVRPEDRVLEIDGQDVSSMKLEDVSKRLKGPVGTQVSLVVGRALGSEKEEPVKKVAIRIKRATIEMDSVIGDHRGPNNEWVYRLEDDPRIAYMRLTSFGEKTVREVVEVLTDLDNDFDALVFDVRDNSGGLLDAAIAICDMFQPSGRIVSTKIRGGVVEDEFEATKGVLVAADKPVAVLINGNSASASEIVAACLQDHDRGVVVGTRSYGKGTVQNILPMQAGRSALRLTVARYYRPSDRNIHRGRDDTEEDEWGVTPNDGCVVELDEEMIGGLIDRWQRASYPVLNREAELSADSDAGDDPAADSADAEPEIADPMRMGLELDPQLRKAVDVLKDQLDSRKKAVAA